MVDRDEYVSFEVAELAKNKGFDENCITYYMIDCNPKCEGLIMSTNCKYNNSNWDYWRDGITNNISAPTKFVLDKWLLYNHHLQITIFSQSQESWQFKITKPHETLEEVELYEDYGTKYEAWDDALKVALNMI